MDKPCRQPNRPVLLHRRLDLWLVGGSSLVAAAVCAWLPAGAAIGAGWAAAILCGASFPHFLATYVLFYRDRARRRAHPVRGLALPLLLVVTLTAFALVPSRLPMVAAAHLTLALLFWHFSKQAFGAARFFGSGRLALATCLAIGLMGFALNDGGAPSAPVFNLVLAGLALPDEVRTGVTWAATLALAALAAQSLRHRHAAGLVPVLALYVWFRSPLGASPLGQLLPFFHGVQYLSFCAGRILAARGAGASAPSGRAAAAPLLAFTLLAPLAGMLVFLGLPALLRAVPAVAYPERCFAAVLLFLNLHHFALDAVLWRRPSAGAQAAPVVAPPAAEALAS